MNCVNCGAPPTGQKCEYCGTCKEGAVVRYIIDAQGIHEADLLDAKPGKAIRVNYCQVFRTISTIRR